MYMDGWVGHQERKCMSECKGYNHGVCMRAWDCYNNDILCLGVCLLLKFNLL